jgi:hypothetical protein
MNELGGYAFADLRVGMCATSTRKPDSDAARQLMSASMTMGTAR